MNKNASSMIDLSTCRSVRIGIKKMTRIMKTVTDYFEAWIFLFIFAAFSLIMPIFSDIALKNGISFFAFQIAGIFIPGMATVLLINRREMTRLDLLTLSYAVGYGLNIVLYYITVPFQLQGIMRYFVLFLAIAGSIVIVMKRKQIKEYESDQTGSLICAILIIVLLIVETFAVCAANFHPPKVQESTLYHDMLYWIGNTITLKKGYPAVSFREYPNPYTYHFFSSMQLSVISLVTNIRPVILGYTFYFIQPVFLMITAAYAVFRRMTGKKWIVALAIVALLFTEGKADWTKVTHIAHLFVIQFGYEISIGFYLLFFLCLYWQLKQEKFDLMLCFITVFLFTITLGTKSSFGAIALCVEGIICMGWLLQKKYKKAFGYGIPILISFVLMYLFVVNLASSDQPESSIMATLLSDDPTIYKVSFMLRSMKENMLLLAGNNRIMVAIISILNVAITQIICQYCVYVPFYYCLFMRIFKTKHWDILDSACIGATVIGTFITLNWGNPDSSVTYFIMATYPPAVLFTLREIECLRVSGAFTNKLRRYMAIGIMLVFCVFGVRDAVFHMNGLENVQLGIKHIKNPDKVSENAKMDRAYISTDDFAAYEWIRCNTDDDTLVIANIGLQRGREESSRHSRVPGVFTERYVISNDDTDSLFYDLDFTKIKELKQMGISYIIYNNTATPGFSLPESIGTVVYSNATNIIYNLQ